MKHRIKYLFLGLLILPFLIACSRDGHKTGRVKAEYIKYRVHYLDHMAGDIPTSLLPDVMEAYYTKKHIRTSIHGYFGQFSLVQIADLRQNNVTTMLLLTGVAIEVGRPITGTRIRDVEKIAMAVSALQVEFESCNPVTSMMSDVSSGKFKEDLLNEKVLSAIIEFGIKTEQLPALFDILKNVEKEIDSVFSLDIACLLNPDGSNPTAPYIADAGLWVAPNGKTNVGLGRPLTK